MKYLNLLLTLLMSWSAHVSIAQENTARVSGEMGTLKNGDTLLLKVYNYGRFNLYKGEPMEHTYTTVIKNHSFAFQIPVSQKIAYVNLGSTGTFSSSYLNQYLIEVNDNVRLSETEGKLSYSGPGSDKVKIALRCQKLWDSCLIKGSSSNYFNKRDIPALYRILDSTAVIVEQYLQDQRSLLSAQASEILRADWLAMIGSQKVFDYRWIINPYKVDTAQKALGTNLNPDASPIFQDLVKRCFKTGQLANSAAYTDFILDQYIMDSCYLVHQKIDVKKCYMYLKQYFMGLLRERLVTQMAYRFRREEGDLAFCINDALSFTKNADFRTVLTNLKSSRIKGAPAYDFALQDTSGRKVSLSQLKGKVVILDFWFTGCGGCREIASLLREMEAEYASNDNVVFVSICIDKQKAKWMSSIHGGLYTSKDCLNLSTGPLGIEHPVIQRYKVGSYPTLIFIDRQGRLGENCADLRMDHGLSLKRMIQAQIK